MEYNNEKLVELKVLGLMHKAPEKESNCVILENKDKDMRVQIVIGAAEAQSIACVMRGIHPPRPLTHDLFVNILNAFHLRLDAVVIHMLPDGIFSGSLLLYDENVSDSNHVVDARSSDAIAIALRTGSKIYISPKLLDSIGVKVNKDDPAERLLSTLTNEAELHIKPTVKDLERQLRKAIETEEYEEASRLKSEIERLRSENDKHD